MSPAVLFVARKIPKKASRDVSEEENKWFLEEMKAMDWIGTEISPRSCLYG